MRIILLDRIEDESGVSGIGLVAMGVELPSGRVVLEWRKPHITLGIYENLAEVENIHGHNGKTIILTWEIGERLWERKLE